MGLSHSGSPRPSRGASWLQTYRDVLHVRGDPASPAALGLRTCQLSTLGCSRCSAPDLWERGELATHQSEETCSGGGGQPAPCLPLTHRQRGCAQGQAQVLLRQMQAPFLLVPAHLDLRPCCVHPVPLLLVSAASPGRGCPATTDPQPTHTKPFLLPEIECGHMPT